MVKNGSGNCNAIRFFLSKLSKKSTLFDEIFDHDNDDIGIARFWNGIPSLFRYRPALEYRPVTDFYGIPAEG